MSDIIPPVVESLILLDYPEIILTYTALVKSTSNVPQAWNKFEMSASALPGAIAAHAAGATKALLQIYFRVENNTAGVMLASMYLQESDLTLGVPASNKIRAQHEKLISNGVSMRYMQDVVVNLDSNSDFDWEYVLGGSYNNEYSDIKLVGYYA